MRTINIKKGRLIIAPILIVLLGVLLGSHGIVDANGNAPSNLSGMSAAAGVTLTWNAPSAGEVTGYQIVRRRPMEGEKSLQVHLNDTGSTATTWTDTEVSDGTVYVYRVKAWSGGEVGPKSNFVRLTYEPPPDPPPDPPQQLQGTSETQGIVLVWDAPSGNVSGYQILRRRPLECEKDLRVHVADTGNANATWTDTDVEAGFRYVYRVKAINEAGTSVESGFVKITHEPPGSHPVEGSPGAPARVRPVNAWNGMKLRWQAPDDLDVTGYQILRRRPDECEGSLRVYVQNTRGTETTWVDANVEMGKRYVYRVRAINANGVSAVSNFSLQTRKPPLIGMITLTSWRDGFQVGATRSLSFSIVNMLEDRDAATLDYTLRGDVTSKTTGQDMDWCEGSNIGQAIEWRLIEQQSYAKTAYVGGKYCPAGEYVLTWTLTEGDAGEVRLFSTREFTVGG